MKELKVFLVELDKEKGVEKFNIYSKVRERAFKEMDLNGLRMQHLYASTTVNEALEKKLKEESLDIVERYGKLTHKIFGSDYPKVKQFYKDYEVSIQDYARNESISVDFGFED